MDTPPVATTTTTTTRKPFYTPVMMVFVGGSVAPKWRCLCRGGSDCPVIVKTALCSTEICIRLTFNAQPLLAFPISLMDIEAGMLSSQC